MNALPAEMNYICEFVIVPAERRNIEYLKDKIQEKKLSRTLETETPNVSAFNANIKGNC